MNKRIAAVALAALVLLAFPLNAFAAYWTIGTSSCSGYMVGNSACFKENSDGSGDFILLIQSANTYIDYLQGVRTPSGTTCQGLFVAGNNVNDCLDWMSLNILSGYKLCIFTDANEGGSVFRQPGPWVGSRSFPSGFHDNVSSIILVNNGSGLC